MLCIIIIIYRSQPYALITQCNIKRLIYLRNNFNPFPCTSSITSPQVSCIRSTSVGDMDMSGATEALDLQQHFDLQQPIIEVYVDENTS